MRFFEFFKKGPIKEVLKTAAIVGAGLVAHEAVTTKVEAKPIETASHNLVVEKGPPSAEVDIQAEINEKSQYDLMVKLARGDEGLVKKELSNYSLDGKVDTTRILELFQIYDKLLKKNEEDLKNLKSDDDDDDDEEEMVRRRPQGRRVFKLTPEQAFSKARDIMQSGEGPVFLGAANESQQSEELTPEQKKADARQNALEKKEIDVNKAKKELPDNLYNSLYSSDYLRILKGEYQDKKDEFKIKKGEYETQLGNFINLIGNKIKSKNKKISIAEAGLIIIVTAAQEGIEIDRDHIAEAVDHLVKAGYVQ